MSTNSSYTLNIGESIGITLARLSFWLWAIVPAMYFLYKLGDLKLIDAVLVIGIFIISLWFCSNLKLSNLIIDFIVKGKKPEIKISILQNYGDIHFYDNTYLKLGLAYKDSGDNASAIATLKKVAESKVATKDNKEKAKCELVKIYYKENDIEETKTWLSKLFWIGDIKNEPDRLEISEIEQTLAEKDMEIRAKEFELKFPYHSDVLNMRYYYTGEFKDGLPHGNGKATFSNRDIYEGDFVNGKMEGEGKYTWKSTDYYVGDFKNDLFNGMGELKYKNGDSYSGSYKQGLREGKGTEIKQQFEFFSLFNRHIEHCPNATKYEGEWKRDIKHGSGKCYDANDKLIFEGRFIEGHPINYPVVNIQNVIIQDPSKEDQIVLVDFKATKTKSIELVNIFISYSSKDNEYKERLSRHLAGLKNYSNVNIWYDQHVLPGQLWEKEIETQLRNANIILQLVSADYLASEYCMKELEIAIERDKSSETVLIPIILRPCVWQNSGLEKFQVLPPEGKPISSWRNEDEAFAMVAEGIKRVILSLNVSNK